ncbi:MAG TPA: glycosyltransferase [Tepidisphaeraceae bacterium]|jgi:glycosyltransferase involved in cell wall biosynthesis|nr:glycosyltransferase [Tepidisphaeraceae bacterium]
MFSVIIPAHNESNVITRGLRALTDGANPGDLEIIVVANGCQDDTAEKVRAFGHPDVRVIETNIGSKTNALNLGDQAATGFPRLYLDADVVLSLDSAREISRVLAQGDVLAAAPAVETIYPSGTTWAVRAYYAFWMALPYIQEGMMAAGIYAVSRNGRARFDRFPDVIADDGYFRLLFPPAERVEVRTARSVVSAPAKLWDLVLIKTRSRLGFYQLRMRFPELFSQEAQTKEYGKALMAVLRRPRLWLCAAPYLWVNIVSRYRARRQALTLTGYIWERDNSSRIENDCKSVGTSAMNNDS